MSTHLRRLRAASGLSQAALATSLNIDPSLVSRYESGERLPSHEIIAKIKVRCVDAVIENVETVRRVLPKIIEELR